MDVDAYILATTQCHPRQFLIEVRKLGEGNECRSISIKINESRIICFEVIIHQSLSSI